MRSNQPNVPGCQSFERGRASHEMLALLLVPILWEEERKQLCLIFLETLRKEFAVPVLLSILAFHRCSVTAARWKKGMAVPGRDLCPAPAPLL